MRERLPVARIEVGVVQLPLQFAQADLEGGDLAWKVCQWARTAAWGSPKREQKSMLRAARVRRA